MIRFEIEARDLDRVGSELGATDRQVHLAFKRALWRTAVTLRRLSERGLKSELHLRTLKFVRHRLKGVRLNKSGGAVGIWFGLNDMPVGEMKGRPTKTSSGAAFRGQQFPGGFKGTNKRGQPTIFKRKGAASNPIEEAALSIKDQADKFIEGDIFPKLEKTFWGYFEKDLAARVKFKIGAA